MASAVGSSWASLSLMSPSRQRQRHQHKDTHIGRLRISRCHEYQVNWWKDISSISHGSPLSRSFLKKQLLLPSLAISDGISSNNESSSTNMKDDEDLEMAEEDLTEDLTEEDLAEVDCTTCLTTLRSEGKPGFISFHGNPYQASEEALAPIMEQKPSNIFWFVGPTALVASFVIPSLYMRRLVLIIFEDSLLTDFLILFFTEALFYGGVAVFVLLIDHVWKPFRLTMEKKSYHPKYQFGLRISSVTILVLSLTIPLVTMGIVWPWTGPAASATLAPYLVGLVVQFAYEQYARRRKSTAWPVIPVIFQVYRLHQLNRAAQLVTALSFSVRGAETTSQTLAINNSLGTLLNVLQILGIICVWSLASFLMRFLPGPAASDP